MASPARKPFDSGKSHKASARHEEEDLLAAVMTSVSASLEKMSEEEREKAVAAAEKAVEHLQ